MNCLLHAGNSLVNCLFFAGNSLENCEITLSLCHSGVVMLVNSLVLPKKTWIRKAFLGGREEGGSQSFSSPHHGRQNKKRFVKATALTASHITMQQQEKQNTARVWRLAHYCTAARETEHSQGLEAGSLRYSSKRNRTQPGSEGWLITVQQQEKQNTARV